MAQTPWASDANDKKANPVPPKTPGILSWFYEQADKASFARTQMYPERWVIKDGKKQIYYGPGLVDENGVLVSERQYDIETDARQYYTNLSPVDRNVLMQDLIKGGFLDKGSLGNYSSEMNALMQAFDFANVNYSTVGKALKDRIATMPIGRSSGGATRVYRTTSTDDLKKIADNVAQSTLGRGLTESESNQFAAAYQQQEVQFQKSFYAGGTVMEAPSPDVAAEMFAQRAAPMEAAGYKYLDYANKLFQAIGVG